MSLNKTRTFGTVAAVVLLASLAGGIASAAGNQHPTYARVSASSATGHCAIVGAISHRCLNFHSDSAWPAGLADYHGSNGG